MPQNMDRRKRQIRKEIYFTKKEYEQVRYAIDQMKAPTFQYYAKNQLIQGRLVQIDFSELKNLRVAINRIGGNINQIAKHANENQIINQEELGQILELLSDIKEMVAVKLSSAEKKSLQERKTKEIRTYDEW
ncbi:TPA: plasmid mobilization relaxosome protein MobC [Streptococcus equi subsp. zooepidemicus]|nr:plasmid mobilization relaxosome protein MobC [Streptococcus equi subsp. zooepidemicus]HEL1221623.1 plasmid mobilization relaxosome protein MobC [Streptococcus equi subsp. zooepidemicus]